MSALDLLLTGGTVVTPQGEFNVNLGIKDGKIACWEAPTLQPDARETLDVTGKHLLPGIVDPHVHTRYPGNPERETFSTGTQAAAAGGVTTILEHPISKPAVHSVQVLQDRISVCAPQAYVDYAFFAGAGQENLDDIADLAAAGVIAFKSFLHAPPAGRESEFYGLTVTDPGALYEAFEKVAATGRVHAIHAECNALIEHVTARLKAEGKKDIFAHERGRPVLAELLSVAEVLELSRATGARLLVCHISGGSVADFLLSARQRGYQVLVETCPHYLFLTTNDYERLGPYAKINPPVRPLPEQEGLWDHLGSGTIDFVGSDHGPFRPEEKDPGWEDIWPVPSGAVGIETMLPLFLNAVNEGRIHLPEVARLLSTGAAQAFDLYPRKGSLAVGADADIAIVDMNEKYTITKEAALTRSRESAHLFDGCDVQGRLVSTLVRGALVFNEGRIVGQEGYGQMLKPPHKEGA